MALFFLVETMGEVDELVKKGLGVERSGVVCIYEALKFALVVDAAAVATDQVLEFGVDGATESLGLGAFAALLKLLFEGVEIYFAQVVGG